MYRTCTVLVALLALAPACKPEKEVDPEEQAARIAKDLKEADTRLRNHKTADAEAIYKRVLDEVPENAQANSGLARLRMQDNQLEEARKLAEASIKSKGDDAAVHGLLGEILAKLGDHAGAAAAYGKAFELEPDKSEWGLPHGVELKLSEKHAEAEKVLMQVAELDPMARFVYTELGDVVRAQNRPDEALRLYMKAQNTYASDKMAHAGAAYVYEGKGDIKHALDEWSHYIRMDCCSDFSKNEARKKIMELQVQSPDTPVEGLPEGEAKAPTEGKAEAPQPG